MQYQNNEQWLGEALAASVDADLVSVDADLASATVVASAVK